MNGRVILNLTLNIACKASSKLTSFLDRNIFGYGQAGNFTSKYISKSGSKVTAKE